MRTTIRTRFSLPTSGRVRALRFISSFLTLIVGFFASLLSFLTWPFRIAWRTLRRHKGFRDAKVKKIIFLGLDGLDPGLTERYIAEGKLPNLKKLG